MKTYILILISFVCSYSIFAQSNMIDVHTYNKYTSEHSTKPELKRTTVFISGTKNNDVITIKMVTSSQGIIELRIDEVDIPYDKIKGYKELTDFVADYAEMPRPKVAEMPKAATGKFEEYKSVNDILIDELKKDGFIKEGDQVFDVMISFDKFYFNGKAQDVKHFAKYKQLYEAHSGKKLTPITYYHFSQSL